MPSTDREERTLVRGAQGGAVADLESLFRRHWPRAYRAAYLIVHDLRSAEEIAQEAFLAGVRSLDRFGRDRAFGPWLYRTLVMRAVDGARARAARRGSSRKALLEVPDPLGWSQPVIDPLADESSAALATGLGFLSPEQRAGIVLRYLLQYSPGEIAEVLDLSRRGVSARLQRDRDYLEARLGPHRPLSAHELQGYLLSIAVADEATVEDRSWDLVRAAYMTREPAERTRRLPWRALAVMLLVAAGVALGVTPAGSDVGNWIRDRIGRERVVEVQPPPPPEARLPADGRVLAVSGEGTLLVEQDGSSRSLGIYAGAAWSPDGAFVVAWRDDELLALDPGEPDFVHWQVAHPRIASARYSSSGFRVAYLSGDTLRIVVGNGTEDRELSGEAAPVAPAWRPGREEILAFARADGRVTVIDADSQEVFWRTARQPGPVALAWSDDAALLGVLTEGAIRLYEAPRRLLRTVRFERGAAGAALAARPGKREFAYSVLGGEPPHSSVYVTGETGQPRLVFAGAGRIGELAWSPDGRYLLVAWEAGDQWLFFPAEDDGALVTVVGVSAQVGGGSFPQASGWCCAAARP
jgi:RNA polymerase sigma-70 factor (ECF subfamily)